MINKLNLHHLLSHCETLCDCLTRKNAKQITNEAIHKRFF